MVFLKKHKGLCIEQRSKLKIIFIQNLLNYCPILFRKIDDSKITNPVFYIFENLMRTGCIKIKLIPFLSEFLYEFHKRIFCKSIMLSRDTKPCFLRQVSNVSIFQQFHLLNDLPCISKEFHSFFCKSDTCMTPKEDGNPNFLFDFFYCI